MRAPLNRRQKAGLVASCGAALNSSWLLLINKHVGHHGVSDAVLGAVCGSIIGVSCVFAVAFLTGRAPGCNRDAQS